MQADEESEIRELETSTIENRVTQLDYESMITEALRTVGSKQELDIQIDQWNRMTVEIREGETMEQSVVATFKRNGIELPYGGWICPVCKGRETYKDGNSWRSHIAKAHPITPQAQHGLMWLGNGLKKRLIYTGVNTSEETADITSEIQYACCPICNFFCY